MPNFYDEVDSTGIVENHIKTLLELQRDDAESMLVGYREIRNELADRLSRLPRGSFTAQHLRGVLAQTQAGIEALNRHLAGEMNQSAYKAALSGVDDLLTEIKEFDNKFIGAVTPVNINAALIARDTQKLLATKYETNLKAYGADMQSRLSNGLFQAVIGEKNSDEVIGSISRFFNESEWKLHRLVRTELHHVYNLGKMNGMDEAADDIPDLMKTLAHPLDNRTGADSKYAAKLRLVVPIDEPFIYEWDGKTREFMSPPDRPNDRSILIPYREEWGKLKGEGFIPGRFPEA